MSKVPSKRIVVVDGGCTARDLVSELAERNVESIHLQSTKELPAPIAESFDATVYDADLGHVGDVAAATDVLSLLKPHAVIAGSAWGVKFAEKVAFALAPPTNRFETMRARRDKFFMTKLVQQHGLITAGQFITASVAEARAWTEYRGSWPVVVKPPASIGLDGVAVCRSHADIAVAFARELGPTNLMGCCNTRLLVQSYLPGPQFTETPSRASTR
jgi:biotin carboxylase